MGCLVLEHFNSKYSVLTVSAAVSPGPAQCGVFLHCLLLACLCLSGGRTPRKGEMTVSVEEEHYLKKRNDRLSGRGTPRKEN
jgi:hypothetical protein